MQGGINFRPFQLVERDLINGNADFPVFLLRFALPRLPDGSARSLGLSQPTTHVKIRLPGHWLRARTFSIVSDGDSPGGFSVAVKVHAGGRVPPWLASAPLGTDVYISHTLTKRLAAPLDGPDALGAKMVVITFGIGVAEVVHTVRRAVAAGQTVALLVAFRTCADVVFLRDLCETVVLASASGGSGSLVLHVCVSRELPSAALESSISLALAGAPASVASQVELAQGRINETSVRNLIAHASRVAKLPMDGAADSVKGAAWSDSAVLAVGSKAQIRAAYALLGALGLERRLLGRPILWRCW